MFQENKTTVIGNWKMHGSVQSNEIFLEKLLSTLEDLNSTHFFVGSLCLQSTFFNLAQGWIMLLFA